MIARIRCEECHRVKVVEYDDYAGGTLSEAEVGEYVECRCSKCDAVTDHEVLGEATAERGDG